MKKAKIFNQLKMFLCLLCVSIASFAQVTTSSINGIITDENNKPIVGATVTAVHTPTGTSYTAISETNGSFNILNMRIGGPYSVTFAYGGTQEVKEGVFLALGESQDVSTSLAGGGVTKLDEVLVASRASSILNSKRTGAATTVTNKILNEIATTSRSFSDLTKLDPRNNGNFSFGGRDPRFNNVTVDGAFFNNAFGLNSTIGGQANASPISLDAIEQIQISLAPYDVRQGLSTGANVNAVTRSGDNEFRGSVYGFLQNNELLGKYVGQQDLPIAKFDQTQFGARIGGPILKNKIFFFVSYEQENRAAPPSPLFIPAGSGSGTNVSAAHRDTLQALRNFLKSKYGYDPGPFENYNLERFNRKINVKLDFNLHKNHKLNVKFNYMRSYSDIAPSNSGSLTNGRSPSKTGLPFLGSYYRINNDLYSGIIELNSKFSDKINNNFSAGYTAMRDYRESPYNSGKVLPTTDIGNGSGSTYTTFGYEPFSYNNLLNSNIIQVQDNLTIALKSHLITVGFALEFNQFQNGFAPNYHGLFRFNTLTDFYNSANNGVANAARYELRYSLSGSFPLAEAAGNTYSAYIQDEWMVTKGLRITGGVRVDIFDFPVSPLQNDKVAQLPFADGKKYNTSQFPGLTPLFSPRLGFNWDVLKDKKIQVRGGVGVFTGRIPFVWLSNQASNNGVLFGSSAFTTLATVKPYSDNIDAYRPTVTSANTSYNLVFTANDFKFPQILRSNIGLDYNLGKGWVVTGEFIYTKDLNAVYFDNIGQPAKKGDLNGGKDTRPTWFTFNPTTGVATANNRLYSRGIVDTPTISDAILMRNTELGHSVLFTVQVQKQFSKGVTASLAYTFTEAKTVNDGGSIAQSSWRDRVVSGNPNENVLANTNNLQQHRITGFVSYEVEWLKYFKSTFSLFYSAGPAFVYSYTYAGDLNGDGQTANDLIYIPKDASEINLINDATYTKEQQWADLDTYIKNDPYLNSRRGQYAERNGGIAPWFHQLDFRFTQDVVFNKKRTPHKLQFTLDIINFLNLLNNYWGINPTTNRSGLITVKSWSKTEIGKPEFTFPYLNSTTKESLTQPFTDNTGVSSRWAVQLGVRYILN